MTTYLHRGTTIDPDTAEGQERLRALHASGERLLCPCITPHPALYLARLGDLVFAKRMPDTGHAHAPHCPHYEPPAELSGLAEVLGSAIVEGAPGAPTTLRLAFPLSRSAGRSPPASDASSPAESVRTDGTRLTLRGTLHHLWHEAGLDRFDPREPRRSWGTVRDRLLAAAAACTTRGQPLAARLFIPEPFSSDHKADIDRRRATLLAPLGARSTGSARPLMLLIAEVKEVLAARAGHRLALAHLGPAFPLHMADDLHSRLRRRFAAELELWQADEHTRLLLVGTFGLGPSGTPTLEEAALALVNTDWIPFETLHERDLLTALHRERRPYLRGLRYNLPPDRPLAAAVLTDVRPRPAALYVLPTSPSPSHLAALAEIVRHGTTAPWFWRTGEEAMPPLPAREGFTGMPVPAPTNPQGEQPDNEHPASAPAAAGTTTGAAAPSTP